MKLPFVSRSLYDEVVARLVRTEEVIAELTAENAALCTKLARRERRRAARAAIPQESAHAVSPAAESRQDPHDAAVPGSATFGRDVEDAITFFAPRAPGVAPLLRTFAVQMKAQGRPDREIADMIIRGDTAEGDE